MPIGKDEFTKGSSVTQPVRAKNQEAIMRILTENRTQAYTQSELQKAIGASHGASVNSALKALTERGEVERRTVEGVYYFSATEKATASAPAKPTSQGVKVENKQGGVSKADIRATAEPVGPSKK